MRNRRIPILLIRAKTCVVGTYPGLTRKDYCLIRPLQTTALLICRSLRARPVITSESTVRITIATHQTLYLIFVAEQVRGDGGPSCFVNVEDTGVPALQEWCHELTIHARERSARSLLNNLATFLRSIRSYVDDMEGVSVADRLALAEMWESNMLISDIGEGLGLTSAHPPARAASAPAPPMPMYGRRAYRRNQSPPPPDNSLSGMVHRAQILTELERMMPRNDNGKGVSSHLRAVRISDQKP